MAKILDHVAHLSEEIGPRPAGTEEEQQAALYIAEQIQNEAGLDVAIEDFTSMSNARMPIMLCSVLSLLCGILSFFLPIVAVPAIVLTLITAVLMILEAFDKPVLSRVFSRGVSQNIVARYEPSASVQQSARRRKIVVVARYDSGKVTPEYSGALIKALPILSYIILAGFILIPIILIIKTIFFPHAVGVLAIFLNVLLIIGLVAVFIGLAFALIYQFARYNEAANSNATGAAVLINLAEKLAKGEPEMPFAEGEEPYIHGEQAAREQGLVPEGGELVYEGSSSSNANASEVDRLSAAKAAVAALSGQPVSDTRDYAIADNLVQVKDFPLNDPTEQDYHEARSETRDALTGGFEQEANLANGDASNMQESSLEHIQVQDASFAQEPASPVVESKDDGVPDWFKRGQEQAKKDEGNKRPIVQRSRYADALDAALEDSSASFAQANNVVNEGVGEQLQRVREGIMETRAPQSSRQNNAVSTGEAIRSDAPASAQVSQVASQNVADSVPADTLGSTAAMAPINTEELKREQQNATPVSNTSGALPKDAAAAAREARRPQQPENPPAVSESIYVPEQNSLSQQLPSLDGQEQSTAASPEKASSPAKRTPIKLPDINTSGPAPSPVADTMKQRAPLAQAEESSTDAAKSLLNMLPAIDVAEPEGAKSAEAEKALSDRAETPAADTPPSPSSTGSMPAAGATGSFAPVSDELIEKSDPEDLYVDDADDSVYEEGFTESGAFAGPGYVDMPKSRVRRFFDRFGGNKNKDAGGPSTNEWLDVDEDFEAQKVGAERGGWESFRSEDAEGEERDSNDAKDANQGERWQGGAFSLRRKKNNEHEDELIMDGENTPEVMVEEDSFAEEAPERPTRKRRSARTPRATADVQEAEKETVYQFRYGSIDTEVWLVALGSELSANAGMKALIAEHEQELRGALFINLDGLGAGELTYVDTEGVFKKSKASSRMKRFVRKASQAMGVSVPTEKMTWGESPISCAARRGFQGMSLVGMENGKPALFAESDDVLENVDEELLEHNAAFVMEMLRNI